MFGDPFVGNVSKKMSKEELVQAIRVDIAGELEAILAYDAHAMSTDDQRAKTILFSIRDEERQHVGELMRLMEILDPQESQFFNAGRQEVEQLLNERNQQQNQPSQQNQPYPQHPYGQQIQVGQPGQPGQPGQYGQQNVLSQQGNFPGMQPNRYPAQNPHWNPGQMP